MCDVKVFLTFTSLSLVLLLSRVPSCSIYTNTICRVKIKVTVTISFEHKFLFGRLALS